MTELIECVSCQIEFAADDIADTGDCYVCDHLCDTDCDNPCLVSKEKTKRERNDKTM
jgi:hypothetical protein